jgi:hypothetical protein
MEDLMGAVYDELSIPTMREMHVCAGAIRKRGRGIGDREEKYKLETFEFMNAEDEPVR